MHNACIMLYNACMPTLQMRDVPDELYQELVRQAEKERRSITQQAIVALEKGLRSPLEDAKFRRKMVLAEIHQKIDPRETQHLRDVVDLIRDDRER